MSNPTDILPIWTLNWSGSVAPDIVRASMYGPHRSATNLRNKRQARYVSRIADAERVLRKDDLWFFELYLYEICDGGRKPFTDRYLSIDGNEAQGLVRIVGGRYSVAADIDSNVFTCQLEILDQEAAF